MPKTLMPAEVATGRHDRLAAPAALLLHCCTGLQAALWTNGDGEELPDDSATVRQQHRVCMAAAASMHTAATAVLQAAGNPALLQCGSSDGGCGSRQGDHRSESRGAAAGADAGAAGSSTSAGGGGGSAVADGGGGSQAASQRAELLTAAGVPPQPQQAPLGAASLALVDSGALAALAASLQLPTHTQVHLDAVVEFWLHAYQRQQVEAPWTAAGS